MLEWLKRHAWKACSRQKRLGGSNPPHSAGPGDENPRVRYREALSSERIPLTPLTSLQSLDEVFEKGVGGEEGIVAYDD